LQVDRFYARSCNWGGFEKKGKFSIDVDLPPWSAQVGEFHAVIPKPQAQPPIP
jgi:hypothetical protein